MIYLSFIIPVFNGEKTITAAMNSVFALPLDESAIEVIVVDDCSTDGTVNVVENYSLRHPGVVLLKQERNCRQGACRNRALVAARGEYVAYLDADDIILPGICRALEKARASKLDMCGYMMEIPDRDGHITLLNMPEIREPYVSGIELISMGQKGYRFLMPTCFLHRRDFLLQCNHPFVEGHRVEDSDFALYHLVKSEKVSTVVEHGYHYIFNDGSTIHSFSAEMLSDYILHAERVRSIMDEFRDIHPELPAVYREYMGDVVFLRFGLWYMTHLKLSEIADFYSKFDCSRRRSLCNCDFAGYSRFQKMALAHKYLTFTVLGIAGPWKRLSRRLRKRLSKAAR